LGSYPSNDLALDLLASLLEYDPKKRLTAEAALEHDYFKGEIYSNAFMCLPNGIPYPVRREIKQRRQNPE
jgi:serine/threonine protein kinase